MLKPFFHECGTSSKPARDGLLLVHPPSPRTARDTPGIHHDEYLEPVKRPRPSNDDVSLVLTTPAASSSSAPRGPSSDRTALRDRPAAMARSRTPVTERARHEARQEGNLNPGGGEGTWGTTGGREQVWGPGLGSLLTMLPWFPRHPNLACTNEAAPRGESPDGHTAEIPHGHTAETPDNTTTTPPPTPTPTHNRTRDSDRIAVVGMCCVEGLTAFIPGEVAVGPPREQV